MTRFVFLNCIAAGPIDWKRPLTAKGQPEIREFFGIETYPDLPTQELRDIDGPTMNYLSNAVASGAVIVGHSVEYHWGHTRATMIPAGINPCDNRVKTICTMLSLTGIAPKANGRRGWPTFSEACSWAGVERAGKETAEDNCRCLVQIFRAMERADVVPEPKIWRER